MKINQRKKHGSLTSNSFKQTSNSFTHILVFKNVFYVVEYLNNLIISTVIQFLFNV